MSRNRQSAALTAGLFSLLIESSPNKVFWSTLLGCLAGAAYSVIIPLVLISLEVPLLPSGVHQIPNTVSILGISVNNINAAMVFVGVCCMILLLRSVSQIFLVNTAISSTAKLRKDLYERVAYAKTIDLERVGSAKIMAVITADIPAVVSGAEEYPSLFVNVATVVGLVAYIGFLNLSAAVIAVTVITLGIAVNRAMFRYARRHLTKTREIYDGLYEGIRGLVYGNKELKLNSLKRSGFIGEELFKAEDSLQKYSSKASTIMIIAINYGSMISLFAIGAFTYIQILPEGVSRESILGIVMVLFYITAPLAKILGSLKPINLATVSLRKIREMLAELPEEPAGGSSAPEETRWDSITLKDVHMAYPCSSTAGGGYKVGPVDVKLRKGEITFIVGGNGSGKTTLGKVISLHYAPDSGSVYFGSHQIGDHNRELFRQKISAIYSDFHLFKKVYGGKVDVDRVAEKYLKKLEIDSKVQVSGGEFSTTRLSDGQRRRLALLVSYLEDREVCVFDEWAADQDPRYREIFYQEILPSLRDEGKLIVVISHDDRYFHLADKIIKMESGLVVSVSERSHGLLARDEASKVPELSLS